MFQLRRILFPVDFSIRCRGAAAYVQSLAGRFDAELILLHVIEASYNSTLEDLYTTRMHKFETFFDKSLRHLKVKTLVEHGEAARKIIEYATSHQVDLIMIPTQGMGIYRRLILGSTSAKVLHDADCPVWTGVHLENAPPLEAVAWQRILCAVDLKSPAPRVLDWANHLAQEYQAELTLVHVLTGSDSSQARAQAERTLEGMQKVAGSQAAIRVEAGDVTKVISHLAGELKSDLLVIGRKEEAGVLGRLEVIAYSLIRQSPCPVVSV
ncbi:MAG TPA: universal stress protein [Bryobacteraceae bacterium]|nr:universal stress protein [Bryobacteraceae bacterium]